MNTFTTEAGLEPDLAHDHVAIVRAMCGECRLAFHVELLGELADHPHGWQDGYARVATWTRLHQAGDIDGRHEHAVTVSTHTAVTCDWYRWLRRTHALEIEPGCFVTPEVSA